MMGYSKKLCIAVIGITFLISACGDSSTGPDPEDAPELPQVMPEEAKPDFSFFDNQPKLKAENNNYTEAQLTVFASSMYFAMGEMYSGFLTPASGEEAEFNDGVWEWSYSYTFEGQSVEMRMTAEERSQSHFWQLFWSFNDGEGNSVENYKVMEGSYRLDGTGGDWLFNSLNAEGTESPALETNWSMESDSKSDMTLTLYGDSGVEDMIIYYEADAPEYVVTFTYPDGSESDSEIGWNTETKQGYIFSNGEKRCWNEEFVDVPCE